MQAPDLDGILGESAVLAEGRRLGADLDAKFTTADQDFFGAIAQWAPLEPVLSGHVGDAHETSEALIGLGEGCANGGLLLAFGAHCFAATSCIKKFANEETAKLLLPRLRSGTSIGALAATEATAGSDVMALRTSAVETRDGFTLHGEKTYISNAVNADVFLVLATRDHRLHSRGVSCFLVDRATPGVAVEQIPVQGIAGASLGRLTLTDVSVGKSNLVGRLNGGGHVFSHAMIQERILLSAFLVGGMKRSLKESMEHALERQQFGAPIAAKQFVSGRIVDMLRRYATSKLLLVYAIERLQGDVATEAEASLTKLQVSEAAVRCQLDAFRIRGGRSLELDGGNCRELIDVLSSLTYSGTSDLQKVIVASALGLPS